MINDGSVINLFIGIVSIALTIVLFDELINFIPDLMKSMVNRVKNKNIITDNEELSYKYEEKLIPNEIKNNDGVSDLANQFKGGK